MENLDQLHAHSEDGHEWMLYQGKHRYTICNASRKVLNQYVHFENVHSKQCVVETVSYKQGIENKFEA